MESEGFGVLDYGATTSFGSVEGAEALFSKSHEHDTRIAEVDPFGGRSFNFGDGASSKATSLSRLPVRNDAVGDFWITVHVFVDQLKPTPLMLGMDFLKEQRCVIDYGKDLIQFPMQSDCWWPLFVSSCGLYSRPMCGQHWEHSSREHCQIVPTGNDCLAFPDGNVHLPDNVNVSEKDESADEQVSENLESCIERSFLSQRQCRLIYQQLRNSDSCLEENFSALMHGNISDGRVCVCS